MTVFCDYAQFYDALYQDKDYAAECDFLEQVFKQYASYPIHTVLDLGCGTGGHALPLAQRGYVVTGVDRSAEMLAEAHRKANQTTVRFSQGDARYLDLGCTFDAVISMFAVISYMTANDDLLAAFRTARHHLQPGGLFIFDAWSGPAVLAARPADRYKLVETDRERVIRFVHPELDVLQHTVKVNYKVLRLRDGSVVQEVDETHPMRFLFPQEITYYLEEAGLRVCKLCPFMALSRSLSIADWNVTVIAESSEK